MASWCAHTKKRMKNIIFLRTNLSGSSSNVCTMEKDEKFLLSIIEGYQKEAQKCRRADAYLAGCVMLGAALEASLLAMAKCYPDEVKGTKTYSLKNDPDLDKWNLIDHLKVARELDWIPSKLPLDKIARESGIDPDEALKNGDLGYFADVVREIRDMLHPGRYLRLWSGVRVTKKFLETSYEVVDLVRESLLKKLEDSIRQEM